MKGNTDLIMFICFFAAFLSGIALILTGTLVAQPVLRALQNKNTFCQANNIQFTGIQDCTCGRACSSTFPCYVVRVQYDVNDENNQISRAFSFIHYDETFFLNYPQCSFVSCSSNAQTNAENILNNLLTFGLPNVTYSCSYNPHRIEEVIITRKYSQGDAVACLLVPSLFFVLFSIYPTYKLVKCLGQ